jgi:succinate dehydrogenase / fumarate reductase cytochrome b subunit
MSGFLTSSIGRKVMMALSAIFLISFLLIHFSINLISVFSKDTFNQAAHFMGTNWAVQYLMQPILVLGVIYHFVMGFVLEIQNRKASGVKYAMNKGGANSTWMSRNMIISGLVILAFLVVHFIDFWIPEMQVKYIDGDMSGFVEGTNNFRYYDEVVHKFENPLKVGFYALSFVLLSLHLQHGFMSAFQSVGVKKSIQHSMKAVAYVFSYAIPFGFIFIALFHFFNH